MFDNKLSFTALNLQLKKTDSKWRFYIYNKKQRFILSISILIGGKKVHAYHKN